MRIKCPKCNGFLFLQTDIESRYFACLNCGLHKNIDFARGVPTSKQTGHYVSVQPRTKAGAYFQNSRRGAIN